MSKRVFRVFSAQQVAKGPIHRVVAAVKRRVLGAAPPPADLSAAITESRRPVSDGERKATLAKAMTPKAVSK